MSTHTTAMLADIDGTLTPPRKTLLPEMAEVLSNLKVPFFVAAGSDLSLVESQFLRPLWEFGYRKDFDAFLNNGATEFHCPYSKKYSIDKVAEFDFCKHLGQADYDWFIQVLEKTLAMDEFRLGPGLKVIGPRITNRKSMVNFAPIGRPAGDVSPEARLNRDAFVTFDTANNYRFKMRAHLSRELSRLMRDKGLLIMLGGQTSFDIVISGEDKTKPVRELLKRGFKEVVFFGDALFPGGNDSVIMDFIAAWKGPGECPLNAVKVEQWEDTVKSLKERGWI
jgi:HAD superfamily hydrolase (TIGR01484 family)